MKTIKQILNSLNSGYSQVSDLIQNKYNFSDEPDYYSVDSTDFDYFGWASALCIQTDGKVLVGGDSGLYDGDIYYSVIKRFNANGSLDNTFTSIKFSGSYNGYIRDIKQQSDGKLIVVGHFTEVDGSPHNRIVRLNTDGTLDGTFNEGTGLSYNTFVVNVLSDDTILVGGSFNQYDGNNAYKLVKLGTNGEYDSSFAENMPSFNGNVHVITEGSNGDFYVGGEFSNKIIRLNSDGTLDSDFDVGSGFNNRVTAIQIQSNGKIVVGGWFDYYNGSSCNSGVVRLETTGSLDNTFASEGTGLNSYDGEIVQDLKIQSNGKIVVGGWFVGYNGTNQGRIIRLNSDGTKDSSFVTGYGFNDRVQKIELDNSENIFCVGFFYKYKDSWCTSQFNYMNDKVAGCVAKLNSVGTLLLTEKVPNYTARGISDGGHNMWDGGAFFNTNLTNSYGSIIENESIPFTHAALVVSDTSDLLYVTYDYELDDQSYTTGSITGVVKDGTDYFGSGSFYFTNLYPGLLVLGAKNINIDEFSITGGIGQDGSGGYNNGSIELIVNGSSYVVFYKTSYGNELDEPSINQLIILDGTSDGITESIPEGGEGTNTDDHVLTGLTGRKELYTLIFGRMDQTASTEEEIGNIASTFLGLITEATIPCYQKVCDTPAFKCYVGADKSCACASWKMYYPRCTRENIASGTCNGNRGAYLPAIVVCNQKLF